MKASLPALSQLVRRKSRARVLVATLLMSTSAITIQASSLSAAAVVSGSVFHDFNSNGTRDTTVTPGVAVDSGVSGILVDAYDATGAKVGSATTANDGTYSMSVTPDSGASLRIEFTIPNTHPLDAYRSSFAGTNSGTSIQFVTAGSTNVDYAIAVPGEYCQNNPNLSISRLCAGASTAVNGAASSWITHYDGGPYTTAHSTWTNVYTSWPANTSSIKSETGSILGMTWDPGTRRIYHSAYIRRHAELYEINGAPVPGAIFATTPASTSSTGATGGTTAFLVDLETLIAGDQFSNSNTAGPGYIPTNAARDLAHMPDGTVDGGAENDGVDSDILSGHDGVYEEVGKAGIGDIESDGNGNLYVVSLYDKNLYKVTMPSTGAPTTMTSLGDITSGVTCTNGNARPFSVKLWRSMLYLGVVCDGASDFNASAPGTAADTNLSFTVRRLDPATSTWSTFFGPHPLNSSGNVVKGSANRGSDTTVSNIWNPWADTYNNSSTSPYGNGNAGYYWMRPQPMLSEIEFDHEGSMIVSFRDRSGDQNSTNQSEAPDGGSTSFPTIASGDIYRVCRTGTGYTPSDFVFEGGTGCAQTTNSGNGTEFYFGDYWTTAVNPGHSEISVGMSEQVPGFPDVLLNTFDPYDADSSSKSYYSGGFRSLLNTTGAASTTPNSGSGVIFFAYSGNNANPNATAGFQKTNGMADIESLCDQAPVQIGNRVWYDSDKDGIQDANESPVAGVTVHLYAADGTTLLGTAVTNTKGEYYFASNITEAASGDGNNVGGGLSVGSAFVVRLDKASDFATGGALHECTLTSTDSLDATSTLDDSIDNDAVALGSAWTLTTLVVLAGNNNHTYDFGCHKPATVSSASGLTTTTTTTTTTTIKPGAVKVGNFVWRDRNGDGLQGPVDKGVRGAVLSIRTASGDVVYDVNGNLVRAQTTKKDGKYLFTNLPVGQYVVSIIYPASCRETVANKPNRARNSSTRRAKSLVLDAGQSDLTLDFGVVCTPVGILPATR